LAIFVIYNILCVAVDKEERKNKNDPEKEIEDSGFQEYSRP